MTTITIDSKSMNPIKINKLKTILQPSPLYRNSVSHFSRVPWRKKGSPQSPENLVNLRVHVGKKMPRPTYTSRVLAVERVKSLRQSGLAAGLVSGALEARAVRYVPAGRAPRALVSPNRDSPSSRRGTETNCGRETARYSSITTIAP